jgi:hypothetical protein
MAIDTTLRRAVRRIAEALTKYARRQGWKYDEYQIYYHVNSIWNKLHVIFVARGFEGRGDFQNYVSVREHLEKELADEPGLLDMLGLIVRSPKEVEEGGIYAIGPEYREYGILSRP